MLFDNPKYLCLILCILLILVAGYGATRITAADITVWYTKLFRAPSVKDALLYQLNDGVTLEYNALHSSAVLPEAVVYGSGLKSLSALQEILGTPDLPETVLGTTPTERTLGKAVTADLFMDENGGITAIAVTDVSDRPVIGLSWKQDVIDDRYLHMTNAFERNGAYIVYLPPASSEEDARQILQQLDGIVMTGGADLNPASYGQQQTPHGAVKWNAPRDVSDLLLVRQAIEMDIPLLAICRGHQILNVALGGSVIQDIPYYLGCRVLSGDISPERVTSVLSGTLPGSDVHVPDKGYSIYNEEGKRVGSTYNAAKNTYRQGSGCAEGHLRVEVDGISHNSETEYHALSAGPESGHGAIDPSSKWLAGIVKDTNIDYVRTSHHQAVDPEALGKGLTVVAYASDGTVEAMEYQENLFVLSLQWHPEKDALGDTKGVDADPDISSALLRALVSHAGIYRNSKHG